MASLLKIEAAGSSQNDLELYGNPKSNGGEATTWRGRLWSYGIKATGVLSTAASIGLVALRAINPWKGSLVLNGLTSLGIGATVMTALECFMPRRVMDVVHQTNAKNAIIVFFALWQADINVTGAALAGIVTALQASCGSWGVSKIVMFVRKRLDETAPAKANYQSLAPGTIRLLLESDTLQSFIVWQTAKGVVCVASGIIYLTVPGAPVHVRNLSIASGSHLAGSCFDRLFHYVKHKIEKAQGELEFPEDDPTSLRAMRYGSQFFYLFGNNIVGALFAWNHPGAYALTFFFLGGMKSSSERRFHKMPAPSNSEHYPALQRIQMAADVVFGAGFAAWYIYAMATAEGLTAAGVLAQRLGLTTFVVGIPAGFFAARTINNRFTPGQNSAALNSALFYSREHRVVFSVVPLYMLQHIQIDDVALDRAGNDIKTLFPQLAAWLAYGGAFGVEWGQKYPIDRFAPILDAFATKLLIGTMRG